MKCTTYCGPPCSMCAIRICWHYAYIFAAVEELPAEEEETVCLGTSLIAAKRQVWHLWEAVAKLQDEDDLSYRNFLRMNVAHFREVLTWVGPRIQRQDASFRRCIPPVQRLAITLCYLATGDSSLALQYNLRVAYNTVSELVYETCEAIIAEMMADVLHCPTILEE